MEQLKSMKECLTAQVQAQMGNLQNVDAKELGEAVDMIKDLAEAIYYCSITEAMEEGSKEQKKVEYHQNYYTQPYEPYWDDRMYYGGNQGGGNSGGGSNSGQGGSSYYGGRGGGMSGSRNYPPSYGRVNPVYYSPEYREYEMNPRMWERDPKEGRARESRRMYMESKEMHKDSATQMKELEKYIKDLGEDITEMIQNATPEEKQVLQQKIATLSTKIK